MEAASGHNKRLIMLVGGIAVLSVLGYALDQKYHWFSSTPPPPPPPQNPAAAKAAKRAPAEPRGKLPWAVGDVNLWDDENPDYCGNCAKWCNSSFSEGHSTQCDMCQAQCPGVRKD